MNPQMRLVVMLATLWASGSLLFAAEPSPAPADATESPPLPEAAEASDDPSLADAADEKAVADDTKSVTGRGGRRGSPQRFTPSEQVRADFDVSFPIDI